MELGFKTLRPVLLHYFVTINQHVVECLAGQRASVVDDFLHRVLPMQLRRGLTQFVALVASALTRCRAVSHGGRRVPKPDNRPMAWRDLPFQVAVFIQSVTQVDDRIAVDRVSVFHRTHIRHDMIVAFEPGLTLPVI